MRIHRFRLKNFTFPYFALACNNYSCLVQLLLPLTYYLSHRISSLLVKKKTCTTQTQIWNFSSRSSSVAFHVLPSTRSWDMSQIFRSSWLWKWEPISMSTWRYYNSIFNVWAENWFPALWVLLPHFPYFSTLL